MKSETPRAIRIRKILALMPKNNWTPMIIKINSDGLAHLLFSRKPNAIQPDGVYLRFFTIWTNGEASPGKSGNTNYRHTLYLAPEVIGKPIVEIL